ncbi:Hypothetical predicted protein [Marmota monax]|uniref:Cadherin domain-containing protein n=1 Tax=Marmota monax TaxID=9995 RepID=A0A5E4A1Y5_MARMO|nr:Hypothetical predicted protein [Marmota monax]
MVTSENGSRPGKPMLPSLDTFTSVQDARGPRALSFLQLPFWRNTGPPTPGPQPREAGTDSRPPHEEREPVWPGPRTQSHWATVTGGIHQAKTALPTSCVGHRPPSRCCGLAVRFPGCGSSFYIWGIWVPYITIKSDPEKPAEGACQALGLLLLPSKVTPKDRDWPPLALSVLPGGPLALALPWRPAFLPTPSCWDTRRTQLICLPASSDADTQTRPGLGESPEQLREAALQTEMSSMLKSQKVEEQAAGGPRQLGWRRPRRRAPPGVVGVTCAVSRPGIWPSPALPRGAVVGRAKPDSKVAQHEVSMGRGTRWRGPAALSICPSGCSGALSSGFTEHPPHGAPVGWGKRGHPGRGPEPQHFMADSESRLHLPLPASHPTRPQRRSPTHRGGSRRQWGSLVTQHSDEAHGALGSSSVEGITDPGWAPGPSEQGLALSTHSVMLGAAIETPHLLAKLRFKRPQTPPWPCPAKVVVFRPRQQTEGLQGHVSPGARVSETVGWQQSSLRWIMEVAIVPKAAHFKGHVRFGGPPWEKASMRAKASLSFGLSDNLRSFVAGGWPCQRPALRGSSGILRICFSKPVRSHRGISLAPSPGAQTGSRPPLRPAGLQGRYSVYKDPAGWLNINPINGTVDTTAVLDRESPFVHNSVYTALFLAIDSGNPPATGTGTLLITLEDVNDNAPFIYPTVAEVCDDAKNLSVVILGATDKDLHPNTDPFKFEIHKPTVPDRVWKISKINNTHALVSLLQNLNKANYNLPIMVTDSGKPPMTNITDLRVQVCSCKNSKVDCNAAGALRWSLSPVLLLWLFSLACL